MKKILITGGSGFLGRNLAIRLKNDCEVIIASRNNKQNFLAGKTTGCQFVPLDVSNILSVKDVIGSLKPNIVIHAAATKFVDLSEKFPTETIDINVVGSTNVARVSIDNGVEFVLGISTDKACPPIRNIYGMSKAIMERSFCLLNDKSPTKFACVRYGNVAWSTGSVLPIWKTMHNETKCIKTTGPEMRRFFFTIDDAVNLVLTAINEKELVSGKILSRYMKSAQMKDILDVWIKNFGGTWEAMEGRPGERLDEYLVGETELEYCETKELNGIKHFILSPNTKSKTPLKDIFTSLNTDRLTEDEILTIIKSQPDTL